MKQRRKPTIRKLAMRTMAALVFGTLTYPALAQTVPSASITTNSSQVFSGDDVKFKASFSSNPGQSVVIRVNWAGYDRYWRLQPNFEFSFPCNLTNNGSHTITIQPPNEITKQANNTSAGAYSVGSPSSATATCN